MSLNPFVRIQTLLETLKVQAVKLDSSNAQSKAHKLIKHNALFSENLFITHSDKFEDYIDEIKKKADELSRLIKFNKNTFALNQLPLLEQQIASLYNAINSNSSIESEAQYRLEGIKARNFKKAAKAVMQTSHELHKTLAEHHEFERRLLAMITDREQEIHITTPAKGRKLSEEILAVHQRLGRCRQAISKIERQIEISEKRYTR